MFKTVKKKLHNYFNPAKKYKVKIIADSTNTPTLDCSVEDLLAVTKGTSGKEVYIFQGQGCHLEITKEN